jgi:lipoprotein-anchoring transpeptidase ErfK/SrfK
MRFALTMSMLVVAALALPSAVAAGNDQRPRLPDGTMIADVPVGGLGPNQAIATLKHALEPRYNRRISIRGGGVRTSLKPSQAGHKVRYEMMVNRAYRLMNRGQVAINVPLMRDIFSRGLSRAINRIQWKWYRAPRNASYRFGLRRVAIRGGRFGRALNKRKLRKQLATAMRRPHATKKRILKARFLRVRPRITVRVLKRRAPTFVSVDRGSKVVRLFKRLRVVRRYRVAVGAAGYETPRGYRRVQSKQRNPAWHAPNRPWAGELAGQTIPPGDPRNPLKAAFISLGDGIGFHGTADLASIGTNASHGCIRMRVPDVMHLYRKVPIGTRVLIR